MAERPIDIIILQTSIEGYHSTDKTVIGLKLRGRTAMFRRLDPIAIESVIDPSRPQLFVTGTDQGRERPIVEFVRMLRAKYPKLRCATYAVHEFSDKSAFHASITKRARAGEPSPLESYIKTYLSEVLISE